MVGLLGIEPSSPDPQPGIITIIRQPGSGLDYLCDKCFPAFRHRVQILILLPEGKRAHCRLGYFLVFGVGL